MSSVKAELAQDWNDLFMGGSWDRLRRERTAMSKLWVKSSKCQIALVQWVLVLFLWILIANESLNLVRSWVPGPKPMCDLSGPTIGNYKSFLAGFMGKLPSPHQHWMKSLKSCSKGLRFTWAAIHLYTSTFLNRELLFRHLPHVFLPRPLYEEEEVRHQDTCPTLTQFSVHFHSWLFPSTSPSPSCVKWQETCSAP